MQKKLLAIIMSVTLLVMVAPGVSALTSDELMAQIAALQAQLVALQAQLSPTTSPVVSGSFDTNLYFGLRSDKVVALQNFLISKGHLAAGLNTGYFGNLTKAAVMAYQTAKSITPVAGYFGPLTRAAANADGGVVPTGSPTVSPTVTPVVGVVGVSLASDNPVSGTLISDTVLVMQNAAPVLKITVANGNSTEIKVNTLKLTRTGFAADADINNLYLYDGSVKVAELSSVATKIFTFNNSSGLFAVPANSSKTVLVGVNVAAAVTNGKTLGFSIAAATDVVLSAGTVSGTFPINSNQMTVAQVTDLGYISLSAFITFPATIDPSSISQELWRFTTKANSQKMRIKNIVLTMVGTIASGDIVNLKLTVGGVQVGSTASIDSSNKVTFDLSAAPYEILSGQNKVFVLMGEVIKGTGRTFKFTIRSTADFVSTDANYGVDTTPLDGSGALAAMTVIEPTTAAGTTINNGTLTISRSADSPSGNIAAGMTNQVLARFDYKANGEDIKVSYVRVNVNEAAGNLPIENGELYFNGSQVGAIDVEVLDVTDEVYSLGNTVVIPAGTTGVFEYRADTTTTTGGSGTALAAGQTITVSLKGAGHTDGTGQTSLTNVTTSDADGLLLTIKTGALSIAKNTSVADATAINPTGVKGVVGVKVGSLILTAGAGEAVNLTQVVVGDNVKGAVAANFGGNFQNLTLKHNGVAIAPVQGTLSSASGADYTFSLIPSVTIAAGAQYVIDTYADILTGAAGFVAAASGLEFVSASATGATTSNDATTDPGFIATSLHNVVIATSGSLVITANASTPVAGQLVMGETDQTFAMFDFSAGSEEDVNVSVIKITDTSTFAAFGSSLSNLKLYDGTTLLGTIVAFDTGVATFNLASNWTIPRNDSKVLTVKASVNAYGSAVSGSSHAFSIANNTAVTSRGAQSGVAIDETVLAATGIAQIVYRTRVVADKASTSPSGAAVVGGNSDVLEFNVAAASYYPAVVNTVAITMSGSLNATSTGDANLYKSTDLVNSLATEAYKQLTVATISASDTTTVTAGAGDWDGIPMGANIWLTDTNAGVATEVKVAGITATVLTYSPLTAGVGGTDLTVSYRPLQPGIGKLYFGAQTTVTDGNLGVDVITNGDTTLTVGSTVGFSVGDTIIVKGYTAGDAEKTSTAGVIATIPSLTSVTLTAPGVVLAGGPIVVPTRLSAAAAPAILNSQNSVAIAYTGLINTSGQVVGAGSSVTFVVKGDTTSTGAAGSTANLRADIAGVADLNWDDYTNYGVITVTKNIPVVGGTLTYTY